MITLANVTRRFDDRVAVDGISFDVPSGELVGFVGANGAGKTTTMRMIMGVLAVHHGSIRFGGEPVTANHRRRFGYMPEERGLYPKQKIAEQLAFLGELAGHRRTDARARATELLDELGLGDRVSDPLESLSLGNQQRVQVAAALVNDPIALILDEPFSGLDPIAVDAMTAMLRSYARQGAPVLFSSHQLDLIERLCDRLVVLHQGRIIASGTPDELRRRGQVRHRIRMATDASWLRERREVEVVDIDAGQATLVLLEWTAGELIREAVQRGTVLEVVEERPSLADIYREATRDVAA